MKKLKELDLPTAIQKMNKFSIEMVEVFSNLMHFSQDQQESEAFSSHSSNWR